MYPLEKAAALNDVLETPDPLRSKEDPLVLRVEDASWQGVVGLRRAAMESLPGAGSEIRVDLGGLGPEGTSAFWLAALVSLRRLVSARGCRLVLVSPPRPLAASLRRLHLEVAQESGS